MKVFNELDEAFVCDNCGFHVDRLGYSCRDHCPNCLYSKHVDNNPGDRSNKCRGLLKPIGVSINPMIASLAMVFSSITVILNALRLKKI